MNCSHRNFVLNWPVRKKVLFYSTQIWFWLPIGIKNCEYFVMDA
uniref:Uncharacterized protein n=1 Tax=Arundo donax TaxID=35708 RepID=A0A0A8XZP8_ARUDO